MAGRIERRLAGLGLELPEPVRAPAELPFGIPVEVEAEVLLGEHPSVIPQR